MFNLQTQKKESMQRNKFYCACIFNVLTARFRFIAESINSAGGSPPTTGPDLLRDKRSIDSLVFAMSPTARNDQRGS
jgi:hypothetical protein